MASPEKMIADERTITDYIPQRPPMVMIGKLISVEGKITTTSLDISELNLFVQDHLFREAGLIENMAQTAAAGAGSMAKAAGGQPRVGFIGGIRDLEIRFLPEAGKTIVTEATIEYEVMDATITRCRVSCDGVLCASCELKIFLQ
jgi:predicted hotdog family 3-hydroxylacyl-ACP dehydratase